MPDLRLPLAKAREAGLLPDLPVIRSEPMGAAMNLYGELIEANPRIPFDRDRPTCPSGDLNEAQRALYGVYLIVEHVPPWEWLSLLLDRKGDLPLIVWAGRVAEVGKTGEYIEHLIRMSGGDPDALASACASDPDTAATAVQWKPRRIDRIMWVDPVRSASLDWWHSDGPGHADFNARVLAFALRRLPELIALEEQ